MEQVIRTPRLLLEPQVEAHAEEMFAVLSDPAIYEYEHEPPASLAALRERFRLLESRRSPDGSQLWLNWVVRADAEAIGYVQATVFADARAAVAYVFASRFWGQGYAREAVAAMLDFLREEYGVSVAVAVFKKANSRSRKLLHALGFRDAEHPVDPDEDSMERAL